MNEVYECLDYKVNDQFPMVLPDPVVAKMRDSIDKFLFHWTFLARTSIELNNMLFNVTYKNHAAWHLGYEAQLLNPRVSQCYANEDWVGRVSIVGDSARHGSQAALRSLAIARKIVSGLCVRMMHKILDS